MNVKEIKSECNNPKEKLIRIMDELLSSGNVKEAKQLEKIIIKLEIWQNK